MKNKKLRIIAYLIPLLVLAVTACLYPVSYTHLTLPTILRV